MSGLPELSRDELVRFSRHITLDEIGVIGQRRLKAARVLCVGAGGLGSPAALYLAAAGVGTIGLVEFDTVDATNLHRQVLYSVERRRPFEAGGRSRTAARRESRDQHRGAPHHARRVERAAARVGIRRGARRHRQLHRALPGQRRVRDGRASRTPSVQSSSSKGRRQSLRRRTDPATGVCIRNRRRRDSCRAAPKPVCSACCPGSSARSRQPKRSS